MDESNGNRNTYSWGGGGIFIICAVLSIALLWANCTHGYTQGYVGQLCKSGASLWDILGIVCCSPLYLIFLIFVAKIPLRFW